MLNLEPAELALLERLALGLEEHNDARADEGNTLSDQMERAALVAWGYALSVNTQSLMTGRTLNMEAAVWYARRCWVLATVFVQERQFARDVLTAQKEAADAAMQAVAGDQADAKGGA